MAPKRKITKEIENPKEAERMLQQRQRNMQKAAEFRAQVLGERIALTKAIKNIKHTGPYQPRQYSSSNAPETLPNNPQHAPFSSDIKYPNPRHTSASSSRSTTAARDVSEDGNGNLDDWNIWLNTEQSNDRALLGSNSDTPALLDDDDPEKSLVPPSTAGNTRISEQFQHLDSTKSPLTSSESLACQKSKVEFLTPASDLDSDEGQAPGTSSNRKKLETGDQLHSQPYSSRVATHPTPWSRGPRATAAKVGTVKHNLPATGNVAPQPNPASTDSPNNQYYSQFNGTSSGSIFDQVIPASIGTSTFQTQDDGGGVADRSDHSSTNLAAFPDIFQDEDEAVRWRREGRRKSPYVKDDSTIEDVKKQKKEWTKLLFYFMNNVGEVRDTIAGAGHKNMVASSSYEPQEVEAACYELMAEVLDLCEHGCALHAKVASKAGKHGDDQIDCFIRLLKICYGLKYEKTICNEILIAVTGDSNTKQFVNAPSERRRSKEQSRLSNVTRAREARVKKGETRPIPDPVPSSITREEPPMNEIALMARDFGIDIPEQYQYLLETEYTIPKPYCDHATHATLAGRKSASVPHYLPGNLPVDPSRMYPTPQPDDSSSAILTPTTPTLPLVVPEVKRKRSQEESDGAGSKPVCGSTNTPQAGYFRPKKRLRKTSREEIDEVSKTPRTSIASAVLRASSSPDNTSPAASVPFSRGENESTSQPCHFINQPQNPTSGLGVAQGAEFMGFVDALSVGSQSYTPSPQGNDKFVFDFEDPLGWFQGSTNTGAVVQDNQLAANPHKEYPVGLHDQQLDSHIDGGICDVAYAEN